MRLPVVLAVQSDRNTHVRKVRAGCGLFRTANRPQHARSRSTCWLRSVFGCGASTTRTHFSNVLIVVGLRLSTDHNPHVPEMRADLSRSCCPERPQLARSRLQSWGCGHSGSVALASLSTLVDGSGQGAKHCGRRPKKEVLCHRKRHVPEAKRPRNPNEQRKSKHLVGSA